MSETFQHEPLRLIETDAELRADLEFARDARVPYSAEAGLARFESALAGGATVPAGGTVGGFSVLRWFLAASAIGLAVAAWTMLPGQRADESAAPAQLVTVAEPSPAPRVEPVVPVAAPLEAAPVRSVEPPEAEPSGAVARPPKVQRPAVLGPSEAELIADARKVLATDPARTLELTTRAGERYPAGSMAQERRGYAILALIGLDRAKEAEKLAGPYLEKWPKGPLSHRIREGLGLLP